MNLDPYLQAMQQLQAVAYSRQTLVASQDFFTAVADLNASLAPENVPGLPEDLRRDIAETAAGLGVMVHPDGRFPLMVVKTYLMHLRNKGLPKVRGDDADVIAAAISRLLQESSPDMAAQMEEGAGQVYAKETMRGVGLEFHLAAIGTLREATAPLEDAATLPKQAVAHPSPAIASEPPAPSSPVQAFSLTDPESNQLLVEGVYFMGNGKIVGPIVSDYRMEEEIGVGGCSKVYRGHEFGPERSVAIKIVTIPNEDMRESLFRGFQRECELQGALSSERFVHVYKTGKTATGSPYIVMEYLSGGALSDFIWGQNQAGRSSDHVPFRLDQALSLASQIVAAPADAHRRGIIHRDIKPENYFLTEDGRAKLGDFGIAERQGQVSSDSQDTVSGTPGYIPPENNPLRGDAMGADTFRRDVFALGVTLYELLTGQFPFAGTNYVSLMLNSLKQVPPLPSQVRPERKIPPALDRIVMTAMAKDPKDRYADAQELLFALVTHKAQALEDEASEILRQSIATHTDEKIHRDEWKELIQKALAEYRRVFDEFPSPQIRDRMVELNTHLYQWADVHGDDETVRRAGERIHILAPASAAAASVSAPIRVQFEVEGKMPRGSKPEFTLTRFVNRAGFLELEEIGKTGHEVPRIPVELQRGATYGVHFAAPGVTPLFIPLPVRPGNYPVRIPIYSLSQVPSDFVVIPAGPVAARQGPGSYSEKFGNWRAVDHDFAMGPLVTNEQWMLYLKEIAQQIGPEAAQERLPRSWRTDPRGVFHFQNGAEIVADAPVTHISYENALEYLRFLSQKLSVPVRLPTLNEWKRALRGNDARPWPWGNAMPEMGVAGFRFSNPRASGAVVALSNNVRGLRDLSPFSVPDLRGSENRRLIPHIAGNVQKFLDLGTEKERRLISRALGLDEMVLASEQYLIAGASYEGPAPSDLDILQHRPRSEVGAIGIMPVIQLRSATPSPAIQSVKA